jgi:hypothetical protein
MSSTFTNQFQSSQEESGQKRQKKVDWVSNVREDYKE